MKCIQSAPCRTTIVQASTPAVEGEKPLVVSPSPTDQVLSPDRTVPLPSLDGATDTPETEAWARSPAQRQLFLAQHPSMMPADWDLDLWRRFRLQEGRYVLVMREGRLQAHVRIQDAFRTYSLSLERAPHTPEGLTRWLADASGVGAEDLRAWSWASHFGHAETQDAAAAPKLLRQDWRSVYLPASEGCPPAVFYRDNDAPLRIEVAWKGDTFECLGKTFKSLNELRARIFPITPDPAAVPPADFESSVKHARALRDQNVTQVLEGRKARSRPAPTVMTGRDQLKLCLGGSTSDRAANEMLRFLASVGEIEDFMVVGTSESWEKDMGSLHRGKFASVVPECAPKFHERLLLYVAQDRIERLYGENPQHVWPPWDATEYYQCRERWPLAFGEHQGSVAKHGQQLRRCVSAQNLNYSFDFDLGFHERGNAFTFYTASGAQGVLVGRDSVAATRLILRERALATGMASVRITEKLALAATARDYGVSVRHVYPVEQPGVFHLDMGMLIIGQTVLLQDTKAAIELEKRWGYVRPTESDADREAQICPKLETRAADDLKRAGLRVVRVPLRFFDSAGQPYNFFNGILARGLDGKAYFCTQGSEDLRMVQHAESVLRAHGIERIYFAPAAESADMLRWHGGLSCMVACLSRKHPH